jgi:hypothetical protein
MGRRNGFDAMKKRTFLSLLGIEYPSLGSAFLILFTVPTELSKFFVEEYEMI